jgi:cytochrome P450
MTKAYQELTQVISMRRSIEESHNDQMPYLQAVVGYMVPQGARVLVNVWTMGRDEGSWHEPNKFMPERFLGRAVNYKGDDF